MILTNKHFKRFLLDNKIITKINFHDRKFAINSKTFDEYYPKYKISKKEDMLIIRKLRQK